MLFPQYICFLIVGQGKSGVIFLTLAIFKKRLVFKLLRTLANFFFSLCQQVKKMKMLKYLNWWLNAILEYIKKKRQTEQWTNHKRPFIMILFPFCLWKLIYGTPLVRRGTDMAVEIESVRIAQSCQRRNRYQEWFYKRSAISHLLYLKIKSDSCLRQRPELSPEKEKNCWVFLGN